MSSSGLSKDKHWTRPQAVGEGKIKGRGKGKLPLNAILVPSQSKVKFNVPRGNIDNNNNRNNETRN